MYYFYSKTVVRQRHTRYLQNKLSVVVPMVHKAMKLTKKRNSPKPGRVAKAKRQRNIVRVDVNSMLQRRNLDDQRRQYHTSFVSASAAASGNLPTEPTTHITHCCADCCAVLCPRAAAAVTAAAACSRGKWPGPSAFEGPPSRWWDGTVTLTETYYSNKNYVLLYLQTVGLCTTRGEVIKRKHDKLY